MAAFDDDLRFAHVLADAADDIALKHFRSLDLKVETKPDLTPVTEADRLVEETLRNVLSRSRPRDAVIGEEYGNTGNSSRCWVLDPIDGTKNYVRGVPVWATLIALLENERPVVGVVSAPALQRRWWAAEGSGAWTGRSLHKATRCTVSKVSKLEDASLSFSSLTGWEEQQRLDSFLGLTRSVWRTRAYGDFWSHVMVAEGAVDIAAEPELSLWDAAPLPIILEEAGGRATNLRGGHYSSGGPLVCTNGALHDAVLTQLNGGPTPLRLT
ncbi:histidinol-phosphatase [Nocardiopsis ansamitocini]|uniref:Histidinol-phosphatase n=1 Tax=Nocardiopsis ansamitocini TaxID=1670832 RepID=A0A9W6P3R4_9ACTN|nr:histidinol-phosphatase [Nocardiopsis ansamitocini]GLU46739.1 histidinol-phosphatase [Nocardiopsis ansamitocini]